MTTFIYEELIDSIKVTYKEGSVCNSQTNMRWMSKIVYRCDDTAGLGHPEFDEAYDCVVYFKWATSVVCTHKSGSPVISQDTTTTVSPVTHHDEDINHKKIRAPDKGIF